MKTALSLSPRFRAASALAVAVSALLTALGTPCYAQFAGQPPAPDLPQGVDQLYALMGTNDLLAMATPEGYERVRQLVRAIDGDTDIIRTKVVVFDTNRADLKKSGFDVVRWPKPDGDATKTASTGNGTLPDGVERIYALQGDSRPNNMLDLATSPLDGEYTVMLETALDSGKLTPTETLRITTRENTVVDTLLHNPGTRSAGGTPFSLIPREGRNGQLTLEITGPTSVQIGMQSGQTAVLAVPGLTADSVRLLFLTPTVLPSKARY